MRVPANRTALVLAAALLVGGALAGCGAKGVGGECADIDACGGTLDSLIGTWDITGVCQYGVPQPYLLMSPIASGYTTPQTPAYAPPPPPPTTSGDWCSGLIYRPDVVSGTQTNVEAIQFYHPPLEFREGNIVFAHDGNAYTYAVTTTLELTQTTHFTRTCLDAYGAHPSCDDLATGLQNEPNPNYQPPRDASGNPLPMIPCVPTSDDGCDCTYSLEGTGSDNGTFKLDGGNQGTAIYEFSYSSGNAPQVADFCLQGDTLSLGGQNGAALSGQTGLRAMTLQRRATQP